MDVNQLLLEQPLQTASIVSKIVDQITEAIIRGQLKPGDKLPTEISLCESFQVGRNSVREAIKILEAYGVVYIKRPDGTFVSDSYHQKMLDPMLYGVLLMKSASREIVQLRKVLDTGIMHTVMETAGPDALTAIRSSLEELTRAVRRPQPDSQQILDADIAFHMAVTRATGNELLLNMYSYVDRLTVPSRTNAVKGLLHTQEFGSFIRLHEEMLAIIENKDFTKIDSTLSQHYTYWEQSM